MGRRILLGRIGCRALRYVVVIRRARRGTWPPEMGNFSGTSYHGYCIAAVACGSVVTPGWESSEGREGTPRSVTKNFGVIRAC